jgi:hypothetical protein
LPNSQSKTILALEKFLPHRHSVHELVDKNILRSAPDTSSEEVIENRTRMLHARTSSLEMLLSSRLLTQPAGLLNSQQHAEPVDPVAISPAQASTLSVSGEASEPTSAPSLPTVSFAIDPQHQSKEPIAASAMSPTAAQRRTVTIRDLLPFINGTSDIVDALPLGSASTSTGTSTGTSTSSADRPSAPNPAVALLKGHHRHSAASLSDHDWAKIRAEKGQGSFVYTWGRNAEGQLGMNNTRDQNGPTLVSALRDRAVVQLVAGGLHTMALLDNGARGVNHSRSVCRQGFSLGCSSLGLIQPLFISNLTHNSRIGVRFRR